MPLKQEPAEEEEEDLDVEIVSSSSKKASPAEDDFDNMVVAREREIQRKKQDEGSKKMGQLLLQGWAMLEDVCYGKHIHSFIVIMQVKTAYSP